MQTPAQKSSSGCLTKYQVSILAFGKKKLKFQAVADG